MRKDNNTAPPGSWPGRLMQLFWAPFDFVLGVNVYNAGLNWKGRATDRLLATTKLHERIRPFLIWCARLAFFLLNELCLAVYRVVTYFDRPDQVRSVLQMSIPSSKPFMVSRALRQAGLRSHFLAINADVGSGILNIGWDYAIKSGIRLWRRRLKEFAFLWTVMARHDVIHSHFKTFLSETGWEFGYLRRMGKVVIFTYRGCDLRSRTLNMQLFPELNCCEECDYPVGSCDTEYQRTQIELSRTFGDRFFVTTPDLAEFLPGSEHLPFIHPHGFDVDAVVPASKSAGVFRVVTSSNHHGIDGTRFIVDAVDRLQQEGHAIELVVVSKQPFAEALSIYKSADVYVGKLRLGYYNNANIETMMLGVPNMSFVRDRFQMLVPDSPIIQTTPATVYDQLKKFLGRRDELRAIGQLGMDFVKRHHDPAAITARLVAAYNLEWQRKH